MGEVAATSASHLWKPALLGLAVLLGLAGVSPQLLAALRSPNDDTARAASAPPSDPTR